jgi:radical SAM protein with 4Fe4S-binding SPASM domain
VANLSITMRCRRNCRYCFARQERSRDPAADMPPGTYDAALDLLQRSRIPVVRLLGGEPTEHPLFVDYFARALDRGFRIVVFSGGLVPPAALECLAVQPASRFSLVLNVADPAHDGEALVRRQREVCRTLGARVMLGVNIRSWADDPAYVFDWVREFELCRTVRLGMAHPIWGGTNEFFRLRGPRVIPLLERLASTAASLGMNVGFDCGFSPCMFSREFVESHPGTFADHLADAGGGGPDTLIEAVGTRCSPVVDILPEGECIACYALSRFRRLPLPSEGTRDDLATAFEAELSPALPLGVFRECAHCSYREVGWCGGGCRARRAQRLRPDPSTPLPPALVAG